MSIELYERLGGAVSQAKAGAPLVRVTIIVPTRGAIRDVLPYLAHHGGVANVQVLTVDLAVTKLAAPALTPRLPLPFPLHDASVQKVLTMRRGTSQMSRTNPSLPRRWQLHRGPWAQ